jgi:beta-glucosidase
MEITNRFDDANINYWADAENQIIYLSRNAWDETYPVTAVVTVSDRMKSSLNDTKKYANAQWNDAALRAPQNEVNYVDAETNDHVLSVVMMHGKPYDDEAWEMILDNLTIVEMKNLVANGCYRISECPSVSFPSSGGSDSPVGLDELYAYASVDSITGNKVALEGPYMATDGLTDEEVDLSLLTGSLFASEPVLASTFNQELAYEQGVMFGEDGLYQDLSFTYGLGANLHRTPFGGRASEYYSSDPVHTSLMGAAQAQGSRSKGQVLVVKHFAVNEQEQNRIGIATFLNEQTMREIYLRAFEGIVTYGQVQGLMTSYNRIGVLGASSEFDLVTMVLRKEWGSNCYVITDLNSPTAGLYDGDASIVAGTSVMMNNGIFDAESGSAVNCTLNVENIKNDPILLTAVREACHRMLYNFVHSVAINGISSTDIVVQTTPWWQYAFLALNIVLCVASTASAAMYLAAVNRKKEG